MAEKLLMPRQGNSVEACIILEWKITEGQAVSAGDIVCEVETDKATFEVPAGIDGTILKLLYEAGDEVPVLEPIAIIGEKGEDISAMLPEPEEEKSPAPGDDAVQGDAVSRGPAPGEGENGADDRVFSSPRARMKAAAAGLPLSSLTGITGSGPDGRVIERDIVPHLAGRPGMTKAAAAASAGSTEGMTGEIPVKGIRKLIADRMLESLTTAAQFTLNGRADAETILGLRKRFKDSGSDSPGEAGSSSRAAAGTEEYGLSGISVNDLILFAVSRLLPGFPEMNAHKIPGTAPGAQTVIRRFSTVHLGYAVDTPRGLMVPVIRNADRLSLAGIAGESKRLSSACREGTVQPDELSGSTFTVTNLGSFGVESFTPVLNIPEVAILGVCAAVPAPVIKPDGSVEYRRFMGLSLTIDHQAVDGAPGARFLKALSDGIASIDLLLAL